MIIGIDASRAFQKNRTGIEEYSYQVIKHLIPALKNEQVVLYVRTTNYESVQIYECTNKLPENWKIKVINFPYLWTHIGLSLELFLHPVDVLFIPGHIVPIYHPKNTIVTIHGLEYEFCPKAYSFWAKIYMRWAIKRSCRVAKKIIAVSENTKKDLVKLYKVPKEKIEVIYEGVNSLISSSPLGGGCPTGQEREDISNVQKNEQFSKVPSLIRPAKRDTFSLMEKGIEINKPYLLFIGRLETRKNICGIIDAYKILKDKYQIPHDLILAGAQGYDYEFIKLKIKNYLQNYKIKNSKIIELGYVDEALKWQLLSNADIFLFPTLYEGFGLPILEAQSVGVPVVASNNSSVPEVVNLNCHSGLDPESNQRNIINSLDSRLRGNDNKDCSALLINPNKPEEIAEAVYKLISDKTLRDDIIEKGYENIKRFSWEKCAIQVAKLLNG